MTLLLATPRSRRRTWLGLAGGVFAIGALTVGLERLGGPGSLTLASIALLYLVAVVVVAIVGGGWLGVAAAIGSDLLLNWFFVPPYHTFTVERRDNVIALLVYVLVAVTVSVLVDLAAQQRAAAARSAVEARLMARITAEPVVEGSVERLLEYIRTTFAFTSVALLESDDAGAEQVVAEAGEPYRAPPTMSMPASDRLRLVAEAPATLGADRRLLAQLAATAARTLESQRLAASAARAERLAEVDRLRTAILAAVGHDLRTPLASIKAAASSLRASDVTFTAEDREELLATVEESTDRLDALVENLLDMSRLQAGVLSSHPRPVALDEVVARALLQAPDAPVEVAFGDDLPLAYADPGLLERVVANLVSNAVRASAMRGPQGTVTLRAGAADGWVRLDVIDHGSGVPAADRERMFEPFQRLGDATAEGGPGLGLAIAQGFTGAMGGTVTPSDTPGGGLTMTVALPVAEL
jgi:two-component system sensor histidine kinase KdpD